VKGERYRVGDLSIDGDTFEVRRGDGERISLPGLTFDLLLALARRAPRVVDSEELIAEVWSGAAVSDETLIQRVALLRRALDDDAREPRYVRSVRGRGYCLVAPVEKLDAAAVGDRSWRLPPRWAVAVAILALGTLFAAWWMWRPSPSPARPGAST